MSLPSIAPSGVAEVAWVRSVSDAQGIAYATAGNSLLNQGICYRPFGSVRYMFGTLTPIEKSWGTGGVAVSVARVAPKAPPGAGRLAVLHEIAIAIHWPT